MTGASVVTGLSTASAVASKYDATQAQYRITDVMLSPFSCQTSWHVTMVETTKLRRDRKQKVVGENHMHFAAWIDPPRDA